MSTKTADLAPKGTLATGRPAGPTVPGPVAYWLEDDLGHRVSLLFSNSEKPLRLAGRALENSGSLAGWTVARRDGAGVRHVVATGAALELLATPFMPERTPEEAQLIARFNAAIREQWGPRRHAPTVADERVY